MQACCTRQCGEPGPTGATRLQRRLLAASLLLLGAMLAVAVAVVRVLPAYAVLESARVEQAVAPRSWVVPLLVAGACATGALWLLLDAFRSRGDDRQRR